MAFILLSREGVVVELLDGRVFETRQHALAALSEAGRASGPSEYLIADLDDAVPVLIVPQQVSAARGEQEPPSSAGAWEAPAIEELEEPEEPLVPEPVTTPATEDGIEEMDVEAAAALLAPPMEPTDDLTDALRRAAGALESSGIVAPASITHAPEDHLASRRSPVETRDLSERPGGWPWDVTEVAAEAPVAAAQPELAGPLPSAEDGYAPEAVPEYAPEAVPEYVPDPLEEPARDVQDLVYADGSDEALSLDRPVILGAYDEASSPSVPDGTDSPADVHEDTAAAVPAAPAADGLLADLQELTPPDAASGYEPGASDIAELTCTECVYVNTCPKRGESDPASCGSFQWKSV